MIVRFRDSATSVLVNVITLSEVALELLHCRYEIVVIKLLLNLVLYVVFCYRKRTSHEHGECQLSHCSWKMKTLLNQCKEEMGILYLHCVVDVVLQMNLFSFLDSV